MRFVRFLVAGSNKGSHPWRQELVEKWPSKMAGEPGPQNPNHALLFLRHFVPQDYHRHGIPALVFSGIMVDSDPPKPVSRRPRPKYQVFISSTFEDLHQDRQHVTFEILKAGHIPAGMEGFPATQDRGWKIIQRTIDRSDYYVVIVAGMYGSVDDETSLSWTRKEYRYAKEKMPVLAFIREEGHITGDKADKDPEKQRELAAFKKELKDAHHCERWTTVEDLRAKVAQALHLNIQEDEAEGNARPGWFRGDEVPASPTALEEFARLSADNGEMRQRLARLDEAAVADLCLEPLGPFVKRTPRIHVVSDGDTTDYNETVAREYIDEVIPTVWFELNLVNRGRGVATNVVCDFDLSGVEAFSVYSIEPSTHAVNKTQFFDPGAHVHIDYSARQHLRQRVRSVAPDGYESLVRFGVKVRSLNLSGDETVHMSIPYQIRSDRAESVGGSLDVSLVFIGAQHLSGTEALKRY